MENHNNDNITRNIIANSVMQIANPQFNDIIMRKIKEKRKRRIVINYTLSCSLLIIVTAIMVLLSIPASQPVNGNSSTTPDMFGTNILEAGENIGAWFTDNMLILLIICILLLLKQIMDIRFRRLQTGADL